MVGLRKYLFYICSICTNILTTVCIQINAYTAGIQVMTHSANDASSINHQYMYTIKCHTIRIKHMLSSPKLQHNPTGHGKTLLSAPQKGIAINYA